MNQIAKRRSRKGRNPTHAPKLGKIDPSSRESIERQVYRRLRFALMSGRIAPDALLTGRSLAQELDVSIQPVRDALKRLEAAGVLESRAQSGFYPRSMTQSEYKEITEVRQHLEGMAGHYAAANMSQDVLRKLQDYNEKVKRTTKPQDSLAANFKLHFTIYKLANRSELLTIIQNLWLRIGPVLHHVQHDADFSAISAVHNNIFKALARRDGPATANAIAEDIASAAEVVIPLLPIVRPTSETPPEQWLLTPDEEL